MPALAFHLARPNRHSVPSQAKNEDGHHTKDGHRNHARRENATLHYDSNRIRCYRDTLPTRRTCRKRTCRRPRPEHRTKHCRACTRRVVRTSTSPHKRHACATDSPPPPTRHAKTSSPSDKPSGTPVSRPPPDTPRTTQQASAQSFPQRMWLHRKKGTLFR